MCPFVPMLVLLVNIL